MVGSNATKGDGKGVTLSKFLQGVSKLKHATNENVPLALCNQ